MKNHLITIIICLQFSCVNNHEDNYKDMSISSFNESKKILIKEEISALNRTNPNFKENLKKSFDLWRDSVDILLDSKYSDQEGSVISYYIISEKAEIYKKQAEFYKKNY